MAGKAHTALVSIAAMSSVLAASTCCLPLLPFVMAAGFAGSSAFLSAARPYLLGVSILLVAFGFYQAWRENRCQRRPNVPGAVLLCLSTVFVAVSIFFPQAMANAAADLLSRAPAGQASLQSLAPQNVTAIQEAFNAARNEVRVLLLLSPT